MLHCAADGLSPRHSSNVYLWSEHEQDKGSQTTLTNPVLRIHVAFRSTKPWADHPFA